MMPIIEKNLEYILIIIFFIAYFCIYFAIKKKMKIIDKTLNEKYSHNADTIDFTELEEKDQEEQLNYYKYKNFLAFTRYWVGFGLVTLFIIYKLPNFFSFFAIWVWAIIITFKEIILSFFGYFYVSTKYKIWENLVFLEWWNYVRGEIIYINALNIWLVGKDQNGESNGQLFRIPNHKFFFENIKQENIWITKYKKEQIELIYSKEFFDISFDEFIEKITLHLDETLPKRTMNNVGYYKSFIGYKYKMRFEYDEDMVIIKIIFIIRPKNLFNVEKRLFSLVESLRSEPFKKQKIREITE